MDIPRRKGSLHHTSMQSVLLIRNAPHSFSQRTGGLVWQQNISPNASRWLPTLPCRVPAQPHHCPCPRGSAVTPFPAGGSCRLPNPSLHLAMKALPWQCPASPSHERCHLPLLPFHPVPLPPQAPPCPLSLPLCTSPQQLSLHPASLPLHSPDIHRGLRTRHSSGN